MDQRISSGEWCRRSLVRSQLVLALFLFFMQHIAGKFRSKACIYPASIREIFSRRGPLSSGVIMCMYGNFTVRLVTVYECTKLLIALFFRWTMHGVKGLQAIQKLFTIHSILWALCYNVSNYYRRLYNSLKDGSVVWFRVDSWRKEGTGRYICTCWLRKGEGDSVLHYNTYMWRVSCHLPGYENHGNT